MKEMMLRKEVDGEVDGEDSSSSSCHKQKQEWGREKGGVKLGWKKQA